MSFPSNILMDPSNIVLLRNAQATHAVFPDLFVEDAMVRVETMLKAAEKPTAPTAPTAAAEKPKKARKATTTKAEAALLAPVDGDVAVPAPAPASAPAAANVDSTDVLRDHKYRLQTIDTSICMGRKIDEANPIEGTRKGDEGANGMFWPEKQCSKKPLPGQKLCKICMEKDIDVKSGKPAHKQYYGRLDEPLYWNAKVIGCKHFFEKYPKGLANDSTIAQAVTQIPVSSPTVKKPAKKKAPEPAPVVQETVVETVAVVNAAPVDAEWLTFLHKGRPLIRNLKTKKVYEMDLNMTGSRAEAAQMDKCLGAWTEDGQIDPYGAESDDE